MTLRLHAATNAVVPAYLALQERGYSVSKSSMNNADYWLAVGPLGEFGAPNPVELLGLVAVAEVRGESWAAADEEIEAFLAL